MKNISISKQKIAFTLFDMFYDENCPIKVNVTDTHSDIKYEIYNEDIGDFMVEFLKRYFIDENTEVIND